MKLFLRELSLQMITEYLTWRDTPAAEANPSPSGRTSKAKQTQANPRDKNDPIFNHRVPPSSTRTHIYPPPPPLCNLLQVGFKKRKDVGALIGHYHTPGWLSGQRERKGCAVCQAKKSCYCAECGVILCQKLTDGSTVSCWKKWHTPG